MTHLSAAEQTQQKVSSQTLTMYFSVSVSFGVTCTPLPLSFCVCVCVCVCLPNAEFVAICFLIPGMLGTYMRLDLLQASARGCPGSTCISPVWLEGVIISLQQRRQKRSITHIGSGEGEAEIYISAAGFRSGNVYGERASLRVDVPERAGPGCW